MLFGHRTDTSRPRGHPLLAVGVLVGVTLFWILQDWWGRRQLQQAQGWKPVPAQVLRVTLRDPQPFASSRIRRRGYGRVEYAYQVYGKIYRSDRYSPVSRNAPYEVARRYRPGQRIRVYVDPQNPKRSAMVLHDPRAVSPLPLKDHALLLLFPVLVIGGITLLLRSLGIDITRRGPGGWRFF